MIKFEIDNPNTSVEIHLDNEGVGELISYLQFIKNYNESIHLTAGNELFEDENQNENTFVKHVKIIYIE